MTGMVKALGTGDIDGDGTIDTEPVQSLHLGVISSNMGFPGISSDDVLDKNCIGSGYDGRLLTQTDVQEVRPFLIASDVPSVADCEKQYPSYITFTAGQDDPEQVGIDLGCKLRVGGNTCGIEQHLEAALKALWPSRSKNKTVTFLEGSGHGDLENKGFLRDDSLLVIVVITHEEDCSAGARGNLDFLKKANSLTLPEWVASDPVKTRNIHLRCYYDSMLPEEEQDLWPVERYVTNLRALRPKGSEDRVMFAMIAGVPLELVNKSSNLPRGLLGDIHADSGEVQGYYQQILDDPAMQNKVVFDDDSASYTGDIVGACQRENLIEDTSLSQSELDFYNFGGQPARRMVALAKAFGVNGVVQSICEGDYANPVNTLVTAITNRINASKTEP
jgi:hypothetical protein